MQETPYDVLIVGGACAGLAAGTYAARRALKTLILSKDVGGQIATTDTVENYPGIDSTTGPELAYAMQAQAVRWGAEFKYGEAERLEVIGGREFAVHTHEGALRTKTLILAYGKTPRSLGVPGEKEYAGRGVSYCVTCDAPLFRDKEVAVVGGGNSAVEGALTLAATSTKVYLVHRREKFRGEEVLVRKLEETPNIELVTSCESVSIDGDGQFVTGLTVKSVDGGAECEPRTLPVSGVFVEIGFIVNSALVEGIVELDRFNQIVTNKRMETSTPGIFACGDLTDSPFKQAVISAGEGAAAALTAAAYLQGEGNVGVDWK